MLVYYFNDEPNTIQVRVMDSRWDPVKCEGDYYFTLGKAQGNTFEVLIPEGYTLYIKKWKGMVMLTTVSLSVLSNFGGILPPRRRQEQQDEEFSGMGLYEE